MERMVVHFYRASFPCEVMDKHLAALAPKHLETKFVRIHAEKAPFLTGPPYMREGLLPSGDLVVCGGKEGSGARL